MVVVLDLRKEEVSRLGPRVLVVTDTERLAAGQQALQEVLSSRLVRSVLVVALGPEPRLPPALNGESRRVLWVGDPCGILWNADTGEAAHGPETSSEAILIDLLSQPEVFDQVVGELGEIPYGTASPAGASWRAASTRRCWRRPSPTWRSGSPGRRSRTPGSSARRWPPRCRCSAAARTCPPTSSTRSSPTAGWTGSTGRPATASTAPAGHWTTSATSAPPRSGPRSRTR
ncbi:hypothetical protein ACFQQB_42485 [Nonomuraea rubra]|uniref:hypothetical protein n=1 Tax=Nonomuraea rubra TaxID=46180 RepID=UPI00360871A6